MKFDPAPHRAPHHPVSTGTPHVSKQHLLEPTAANDSGSPNPLTNMDGFGIGWWSDSFEEYENGTRGEAGMRPVMYKNTRPPLNDLVLKSLARGVQTKAVVAHIRAGTGESTLLDPPPGTWLLLKFMHTPGLTPVVETNCHPYAFGRHLFCHNGVLGSFHLMKTNLLCLLPMRYQMAILGTTDSEHIAALYFLHLCGEAGDWEASYPVEKMALAMRQTIVKLEEMKSAAESKAGVATEYNALNLLASSGSSMVALRYASPREREPPSLYYSTSAGGAMNRKFNGHPDEGKPGTQVKRKDTAGGAKKHDLVVGTREKGEHGKHVIVCSEPTTYNGDDWNLMAKDEMVVVGADMAVRLESLNL